MNGSATTPVSSMFPHHISYHKEQDNQAEEYQDSKTVACHNVGHLVSGRLPVTAQHITEKDPDQIPRTAADKGEQQYPVDL